MMEKSPIADEKVQSSFKWIGTVLGAIILILGIAVMVNTFINPPIFGFIQDISVGAAGILIGAIVIYAARGHD